MEDILNNIISASKRKADEDVENEEEIVNLLEILANFVKEFQPGIAKRILTREVLEALNSFESPRVREGSFEIVEKTFSSLVDDPNCYDYVKLLLSGFYEKVALQKLQSDVTERKILPPGDIMMRLIELLLCDKTSISSPTETLIGKIYEVVELSESQRLTTELYSRLVTSNAEQACRILEIAVQASLKSQNYLKQMEEIIKFCLLNPQLNDDILYQMNLLEILQNLFAVDYGFEFLEMNGILNNFAEQIVNPEKALLAPGIMRFFTHAAVTNPRKILNEYSALVELLMVTIRDDESFQPITLETLGQIFLTNDSKRILHEKYDRLCCETLKNLYAGISRYPSDLKSRVFEALEMVFQTDNDANVNNQITYICENWFKQSQITFSSLLGYCKQPFPDISLAAFRLINSLLSHAFGRHALIACGGFIEYLLDRKSISSYEVAQIKYQIITKLSTATEFDVATTNLFCAYVRNGLYYNDQSATAILYE